LSIAQLFGFLMLYMLPTSPAIFAEPEAACGVPFIFGSVIVAFFADGASHRYHNAILFTLLSHKSSPCLIRQM
jgi:hypothetical protein